MECSIVTKDVYDVKQKAEVYAASVATHPMGLHWTALLLRVCITSRTHDQVMPLLMMVSPSWPRGPQSLVLDVEHGKVRAETD